MTSTPTTFCDSPNCPHTAPTAENGRPPTSWLHIAIYVGDAQLSLDFDEWECLARFALTRTDLRAVPRGSVVLGLEDAEALASSQLYPASKGWQQARSALIDTINAVKRELQPPAAEPAALETFRAIGDSAVCEECRGTGLGCQHADRDFDCPNCQRCHGSGRKEG